MASVEIPVRSDLDDFSHVVDLDGVTYQIRLVKNMRDMAWAMDIRDAEGTPLLTGRLVRVDVPLTGLAPRGDLPPGLLIAQDTSGEGEEIDDWEDLGSRVRLMYTPEDDV